MSETPTILIADDDKDLVRGLSERCSRRGLQVVSAHDSLTAINSANKHSPDVICLDIEMPNGNGLGLCEMLASHEHLASVPVIILTGHTDPETVRRCHSLCAYYVPKLPDVWKHIEPLLEELLGERMPTARRTTAAVDTAAATTAPVGSEEVETMSEQTRPASAARGKQLQVEPELVDVVFSLLGAQTSSSRESSDAADEPHFESPEQRTDPWVLCIDDDADYSMALALRLERKGVHVVRALQGMEGYRLAFTRPADVILLDYELPNGQGDYILNRLRDNPVTRDIPVIVITGRKDRALERKMMNLGAARFLNKPVEFEVLLNELSNHVDFAPVYS